MSTQDLSKFDVRTIERYLAEGKVTRADYDAYLAALPDDADESVESSVQFSSNARGRRADFGSEPGPDEDEG
jgi:hypothetical protein